MYLQKLLTCIIKIVVKTSLFDFFLFISQKNVNIMLYLKLHWEKSSTDPTVFFFGIISESLSAVWFLYQIQYSLKVNFILIIVNVRWAGFLLHSWCIFFLLFVTCFWKGWLLLQTDQMKNAFHNYLICLFVGSTCDYLPVNIYAFI